MDLTESYADRSVFVTGHTGFTGASLAEWLGILDAEVRNPVFYLSGPPQMLSAVTAQLRRRGVSMEGIRTDAWE
jgi:nucleoside-diphosphate-sugar epimerase